MLVSCKRLFVKSLGELLVVFVVFKCIVLISKVELKVDDKFINFDVVGTDINECVIGEIVFRCRI